LTFYTYDLIIIVYNTRYRTKIVDQKQLGTFFILSGKMETRQNKWTTVEQSENDKPFLLPLIHAKGSWFYVDWIQFLQDNCGVHCYKLTPTSPLQLPLADEHRGRYTETLGIFLGRQTFALFSTFRNECILFVLDREYWMIYGAPGFLLVVWFGSMPTPFSLSSQQVSSFSVFLCDASRQSPGGGRGAESHDCKTAWPSINQ
jgi:hypothetical protein